MPWGAVAGAAIGLVSDSIDQAIPYSIKEPWSKGYSLA